MGRLEDLEVTVKKLQSSLLKLDLRFKAHKIKYKLNRIQMEDDIQLLRLEHADKINDQLLCTSSGPRSSEQSVKVTSMVLDLDQNHRHRQQAPAELEASAVVVDGDYMNLIMDVNPKLGGKRKRKRDNQKAAILNENSEQSVKVTSMVSDLDQNHRQQAPAELEASASVVDGDNMNLIMDDNSKLGAKRKRKRDNQKAAVLDENSEQSVKVTSMVSDLDQNHRQQATAELETSAAVVDGDYMNQIMDDNSKLSGKRKRDNHEAAVLNENSELSVKVTNMVSDLDQNHHQQVSAEIEASAAVVDGDYMNQIMDDNSKLSGKRKSDNQKAAVLNENSEQSVKVTSMVSDLDQNHRQQATAELEASASVVDGDYMNLIMDINSKLGGKRKRNIQKAAILNENSEQSTKVTSMVSNLDQNHRQETPAELEVSNSLLDGDYMKLIMDINSKLGEKKDYQKAAILNKTANSARSKRGTSAVRSLKHSLETDAASKDCINSSKSSKPEAPIDITVAPDTTASTDIDSVPIPEVPSIVGSKAKANPAKAKKNGTTIRIRKPTWLVNKLQAIPAKKCSTESSDGDKDTNISRASSSSPTSFIPRMSISANPARSKRGTSTVRSLKHSLETDAVSNDCLNFFKSSTPEAPIDIIAAPDITASAVIESVPIPEVPNIIDSKAKANPVKAKKNITTIRIRKPTWLVDKLQAIPTKKSSTESSDGDKDTNISSSSPTSFTPRMSISEAELMQVCVKLSRCKNPSRRASASPASSIIESRESSPASSQYDSGILSNDGKLSMALECSYAGCWEIFTSALEKTEHMKLHQNQFTCKKCVLHFATKYELSKHERDHDYEYKDTNKCKCIECGEAFVDEDALNRHAADHLQNSKAQASSMYPCAVCNTKFNDAVKLKNHLVERHGEERQFVCLTCKRSFAKRENLKRHCASKAHKCY